LIFGNSLKLFVPVINATPFRTQPLDLPASRRAMLSSCPYMQRMFHGQMHTASGASAGGLHMYFPTVLEPIYRFEKHQIPTPPPSRLRLSSQFAPLHPSAAA
jgi:hypothetical protein